MSSYILKNTECIDFFNKNKGIDFETSVVLIVRMMKNLTKNIQQTADSEQNIELLKAITKKIDGMHENQTSKGDELKEYGRLLTDHKKDTVQSVREIIQSSNAEHYKVLHNVMKEDGRTGMYVDKIVEGIRKKQQDVVSHIERIVESKDQILRERLDHHIRIQLEKQDKVLEKVNSHDGCMVAMSQYLQKQMGSNTKGKQGEKRLELILSQMYPSSSIVNTSGQTSAGDFKVQHRKEDVPILIDTKDYDTTVPDREVEKFFNDIELQKCDGILLSQSSGIAQKNNYEFVIHGGLVGVFVHSSGYDPVRIRIGMDILEQVRRMIKRERDKKGVQMFAEERISEEVLSSINNEYNMFIMARLQIMDQLKKQYQDNIGVMERIQLPSLERYLDTKFANIKKSGYACEMCESFVGKNKKSLAAHQKKCKGRISNQDNLDSTSGSIKQYMSSNASNHEITVNI